MIVIVSIRGVCNTTGYTSIQIKAATQEEHTRAQYTRVYRTDTELCSDNIQLTVQYWVSKYIGCTVQCTY